MNLTTRIKFIAQVYARRKKKFKVITARRKKGGASGPSHFGN